MRTGFPSPAAVYITGTLDFNQYLVSNAVATFALFAAGDSMVDAGIRDGDLLAVDRARGAVNGDIVVAQVGVISPPSACARRMGALSGIPSTRHRHLRWSGCLFILYRSIGLDNIQPLESSSRILLNDSLISSPLITSSVSS
ncbi:LexA family protein [Laribacter hongkongensis]|uniref:LexA family protein n=1 Tax=Laribacter hongkongensis TaxID=168471 RepID=UPI0028390FAC|nr:hypothetical protein [Laribacter hongkongensis]MCG9122572.1 hypothetical protein [Laribacter hongkongensis]